MLAMLCILTRGALWKPIRMFLGTQWVVKTSRLALFENLIQTLHGYLHVFGGQPTKENNPWLSLARFRRDQKLLIHFIYTNPTQVHLHTRYEVLFSPLMHWWLYRFFCCWIQWRETGSDSASVNPNSRWAFGIFHTYSGLWIIIEISIFLSITLCSVKLSCFGLSCKHCCYWGCRVRCGSMTTIYMIISKRTSGTIGARDDDDRRAGVW